mmetsp:Transcript_13946/g.16828  ORF Transcript_13946/g.16828 Transcript_13946/m.16828 type:complete len:105 (-) Transcript_13946:103-417(-)|eukprot:CAMPEP_0197853202 /NCGR_PEP_ID=MMETSP1438-20131217/22272_1 /TAXON_ID=1461541 /ORGANISM="Pterosperma sp., Strain CCMP1384" /LENGTH=104 /DNA_ID=CAMNT_0043467515 /DNA_START=121 /DNA_END=435 /DNA_ORIENTATION=-
MDPGALGELTADDQKVMMKMVEDMQTRDSLKLYNRLVERCFSHCVDSFRRKTLDGHEEKCVAKCAEKFLKHTARASLRFHELNAMSEQQMMAQMQQMQAQQQQK